MGSYPSVGPALRQQFGEPGVSLLRAVCWRASSGSNLRVRQEFREAKADRNSFTKNVGLTT